MDNDDEIMFFQMMAEDAALAADDEENEMVMAALLDATVKEDAAPKFGGSVKGRRANKEHYRATGHMLTTTTLPRSRRTFLMNFTGTLG